MFLTTIYHNYTHILRKKVKERVVCNLCRETRRHDSWECHSRKGTPFRQNLVVAVRVALQVFDSLFMV